MRDHSTPTTTNDPERRPLPRRALLAGGGAALAGVALLRAEPAGATTGNLAFGSANDAGSDTTSLTSSHSTATLTVTTTSASTGAAIVAEITDSDNYSRALIARTAGESHALVGEQNNVTSDQACVAGVHYGLGAGAMFVQDNVASTNPGVWGQTAGDGPGVLGSSYGAGAGVIGTSTTAAPGVRGSNSSTGPAVYGVHSSSGVAVWGTSPLGRGAQFAGGKAQVRLVPSDDARPAVGKAGDLFVDQDKHLWFCRGGSQWTRLT